MNKQNYIGILSIRGGEGNYESLQKNFPDWLVVEICNQKESFIFVETPNSNTQMTKKILIKKLEGLQEIGGFEKAEEKHVKADKLLLDFIGDKEVSNAFDKIDKWYS